MPLTENVLTAFQEYVVARKALLEVLNLGGHSNRDPLSEFSEWLVAALVDGTLATSRVQKGWDVSTPTGDKIQVKYLANSAENWVNEHLVQMNEDMTAYALVIFESLLPVAVIIFPASNLRSVTEALKKRHGNQDTQIQFTRANYRNIIEHLGLFAPLGVRLYLAPSWTLRTE